jgi:hypothetical protein
MLIKIIYFQAKHLKTLNELATVAFLACEGFSHRVFPHEGFDAPVFVGVGRKYQLGVELKKCCP